MLGRIRKTHEGFNIAAPGAVDELLDLHRSLFGAARMEDEGDADSGGGDSGTGSGDANANAGAGTGKPGEPGEGEPSEAERIAEEFAAARTGRKAAEKVISELTGKTVTQVRKAFRDAKGDTEKAIESLGTGRPTAKPGSGEAETPDVDKLRQEAEQKATEAANARIVRSEVKALAADTFANPADALTNLDLADYELTGDGELEDPEQVKKDLAAVLKKYPHYARKRNPAADRAQGRGGDGTGGRPTSMRELSRMRVED